MSKSHLNEKWESCLEECLTQNGYTTFRITISQNDKVRHRTGSILNVTVEGRKDREFTVEFLVMKTIGERDDETLGSMFKTEAIVYNEVVPMFKSLQKDLPSGDRVTFPSTYAATEEYVVMSDLVMVNMTPSEGYLDFERTCVAVSELARFHAFSFGLRKVDPLRMLTMSQKLNRGFFHYHKLDETRVRNVIDRLQDTSLKEKMEKFAETCVERVKALCDKQDTNKLSVITHGEYNYENILFACDEDEEPINMIMIDFQLSSMNSPLVDILFLLFTSSEIPVISQLDFQMDLYHDSMRLALNKYQCKIDEVYPKSVFTQELKEYLPYVLVQFLYREPNIYADDEFVKRMESILSVLSGLNLI